MAQTGLFKSANHRSLSKHKPNSSDSLSLNQRYKPKVLPYPETKDRPKRTLNRQVNSKSQLQRNQTLNFDQFYNQISSQKFIDILDLMRKKKTSHFAFPLNSYAAKISESRKSQNLVIGVNRKVLFEKLNNSGAKQKKNKFKIFEKMETEMTEQMNGPQISTPETQFMKHMNTKSKNGSFNVSKSLKLKRENEEKNLRAPSIEKKGQRSQQQICQMYKTLSQQRYPCEIKQITLRSKQSIVLKKICKKENKKHFFNFNVLNWRKHRSERKKSELCPWENETHFLTE